jgi:hypothetical protein
MRVFVKNIFLFTGIILFPLVLYTGFIYVANSILVANYRVNPGVNTIVIGDSHTQKAINDQYFPNAINLSQSSESFLYSYVKLKEILKHNPNIKTVLLGCSFHSFSAYYDEFVIGKYSSEISAGYFFAMPVDLQWQFLYRNNTLTGQYLKRLLETGFHNLDVDSGRYSFLGCYEPYETKVKMTRESVSKRVNTHYFHDGQMYGFSSVNIDYLQKIASLCKEKSIRLILLNTPLHGYYIENVPDTFRDRFYSLVNVNKFELIEFNGLHLNDSCFLPDGDHVTGEGARLTTQFLVRYLRADSVKTRKE